MKSSQNETIMLVNDWNEICFNEFNMENKFLNGSFKIKFET
jgi:hypothetical protein